MTSSDRRPYLSGNVLPLHEVTFVTDRRGDVWRIVRDGGMAARIDRDGEIESAGINWLRENLGPLVAFDPVPYRTDQIDGLSAYDLRLRSMDTRPDELPHQCSHCNNLALWSVWLHTPEWPERGGLTLTLCTPHALESVGNVARAGHRAVNGKGSSAPSHGVTE